MKIKHYEPLTKRKAQREKAQKNKHQKSVQKACKNQK